MLEATPRTPSLEPNNNNKKHGKFKVKSKYYLLVLETQGVVVFQ
jgi:hypothetical protein